MSFNGCVPFIHSSSKWIRSRQKDLVVEREKERRNLLMIVVKHVLHQRPMVTMRFVGSRTIRSVYTSATGSSSPERA